MGLDDQLVIEVFRCFNWRKIMTHVDKYQGQHWDGGPTMEVVRARHKAVLSGKCNCKSKKDPTDIKRTGSRSWISCYRCLGQIKQLS